MKVDRLFGLKAYCILQTRGLVAIVIIFSKLPLELFVNYILARLLLFVSINQHNVCKILIFQNIRYFAILEIILTLLKIC